MKHIPQRTCIVCRRQKDKSELLRVVRKPDGSFEVDSDGRAAGRGAYICRQGDCFCSAIKKRALNRAFKDQIANEVYDELAKAYNESTTDAKANR